MPIQYFQQDDEGPSVPAQKGILEDPDEDTLRIMISTDNHLGYEENDSVRGMDSFAAFEEVLYLAKRFRCDMVLLAGDLFHENRPSRRTLYKTMEILRRYCCGPGAVRVQITSDPTQTIRGGQVNYQDPNFAIDLPIFCIHGNHDDPTRDGGDLLAALDLLSVSNMVNYFGCQEQVDNVRLYPAMLQKGTTQIGLYGLGSMRDERLNRMWREGKVKFFRYQNDEDDGNDDDDEEEDDSVFYMFCLHQNRDVGRGSKNCVQETLIPDFCDLVVWGHEHECQIEFSESLVGTFRITQPGSSVATSLVAGEAVRKKVGVLDVKGKNFRMHTVPLTQVRSFVMSEINLREHRANLDPDDSNIDKKVTKVLEEQVNAIILDAKEEQIKIVEEAKAAGSNAAEGDSPLVNRLLNPEKVLVRLRVEHTGFSTLNNQRFGAKFVDEIANSDNILLFRREKVAKPVESKATRKAREAIRKPMDPDELERTNVEDLVSSILELPGSKLELLSEKSLGEALEEYVDKNNLQSIPLSSEEQLKKRQKLLISNPEFSGKAEEVQEAFHQEATSPEDAPSSGDGKKTKSTASNKRARSKKESVSSDDEQEQSENLENSRSTASSSSKRTSAAAKSTTTKSASSRNKTTAGRRKQKFPDSDEDDDVVVVDNPPSASKSRTRRSTRKVNYAGADDDGDDSDAVVDMMDNSDGGDDDVMEVEPPPKGRKMAASRKTTKPTPRRKTAPSTRKSTRKKRFADDSDDDDDDAHRGASIGLDADWGSAATRSQL